MEIEKHPSNRVSEAEKEKYRKSWRRQIGRDHMGLGKKFINAIKSLHPSFSGSSEKISQLPYDPNWKPRNK